MNADVKQFIGYRSLHDPHEQFDRMRCSLTIGRLDDTLLPEAVAYEYLSDGDASADNMIGMFLEGLMLQRKPSTETALTIGRNILQHTLRLSETFGRADPYTLAEQSRRLEVWLRRIDSLYAGGEIHTPIREMACEWNARHGSVPVSVGY